MGKSVISKKSHLVIKIAAKLQRVKSLKKGADNLVTCLVWNQVIEKSLEVEKSVILITDDKQKTGGRGLREKP